jgi:hypothetical protein
MNGWEKIMKTWYKYPDEKPPLNEYLLCWGIMENQLEYDIHKASFYEVEYEDKKQFEFCESEWAYTINNVTHWMEFPEKPKENDENLAS